MRQKADKFVLFCAVISVLCLIAISVVSWTVLDTHSQTQDIQEGRRISQPLFCAAMSAVIDAGRSTITGGQPKPGSPLTPLERNLRKLGYPPRQARRRMADQAAKAYSSQISEAIQAAIPATLPGATDLVRPDGTLNCRALARATGTKPQ